ncbi:hypothetical protein [Vagococcus fluvialis]|uniref:hypothetical protein n=1 Tax=Vagococcus fluvialis TaxID=2738 RepID=UPI0037ACCAEB
MSEENKTRVVRMKRKILNVVGKILAVSYLIILPMYLFDVKQPSKLDLLIMATMTINYFWNYFGKEVNQCHQ